MKVLIVDDNENITSILSEYLTIKDFEVSVALDGRSGLSLIQNKKFDHILLDLSMPEFSGFDIIEALEKNGQLEDQKIIIFTAISITKKMKSNLLSKDGIIGYLEKPVALTELERVLSE